jgi:GDPmannose 4,6-dehydratase
MQSALIIGAGGQDGRLLARFLADRGYAVRGWTRTEPAGGAPCECALIDLLQPASVERKLQSLRPDEIYYLAAFHHSTEDSIAERAAELLRRSFDVHVAGLVNVLQAMKVYCPRARLFYAASSHVFGAAVTEWQDEQTPFMPTSAYGISKTAGIQCCQLYRREEGIFAATGILFNHESSLRKPSFLSQKIVRGALRARRDPDHKLVLGDLDARVDWGYAPDYVDAMFRILQLPKASDFVVASGEMHTVREFAGAAFDALGLDWRRHIETDAGLLKKISPSLRGDANKLRAATGWSPTVNFAELVAKLVDEAAKTYEPSKLLIFIPTYNEVANVERLCRELTELCLGADILFCDDCSPDGTGEIVERLAREFPHVRTMHRPGKLGIGSAHQDGIRYAYAHGYETLVTMDCDFTHQPADVQRLLEIARASGRVVSIGSRYMERGSLPGWNLMRRSVTHLGHFLTVNLLHLPQDATGALRVYQLGAIPKELFDRVRSCGYSFFFESLFVLHRNGFVIEEMPIALPARTYGHSKMCLRETLRSASRLLKLCWAGIRRPESFLLTSPLQPILGAELPLQDPQGWDSYWMRGQEKSRRAYAFVASLYRRLAIRRNLNYFIHKHFFPGARLLHAGCGSGQVDSELSREMRITAVDISLPALESYRRNNPSAEAIRHGDILHLTDVAGGSFDGAYNLGVVEHFTHDQIVQILREMGRAVKPGGKVVIFWPHRRATSVFVLKMIHRVIDRLRRDGPPVRLHPPEISLLESRDQAREMVERAGFNLIEYYFGIRDLLVQAVVVGCKR